MKSILNFLFITFSLIHCNFILAQNKTTIANGDWSNPNIWSPVGVPSVSTDSIFIHHNVSTTQKRIINGPDYFKIFSTGCLYSITGLDTISFLGSVDVVIDGNINFGLFSNQASSLNVNGNIVVSNLFTNLSGMNLNSTGKISCYKFSNGIAMVHDGELQCEYFINLSFISGSGKFCVSDTLRNQQDITGTIDLCDATPNGPGDYNIGTIASTVTYCAVAPCSSVNVSCSGVGINENNQNKLFVFPNPTNGVFTINNLEDNSSIKIYNSLGLLVSMINEISHTTTVDLTNFANGIYFLKIGNYSTLLIKE